MNTKKLKIAWLHSHLLYWMGGSIYIYEVLKALTAQKNCQAILITSVASDFSKKQFQSIGVEIKELSGFSTNSSVYWLFLPIFLKMELACLKKEIKDADVVISSMFPMNVLAAKTGKPFIQLCYEPYAFFHDRNFIAGFPYCKRIFIQLAGRVYSSLDIKATKKATKILTLSKKRKKWIENVYGRDDAVVVYYGVDSSFFKKKKNTALSNKCKDKDIIFHSTDFTAIKGTKYLVQVLPGIIDKFPNTLLLVTHTLENQKAKQEVLNLAQNLGVAKNMKFLGFVKKEELPFYYSLAKVVVQPSIGQSMNLFALEAMACQTPVILNPEGEEQTRDNEAGLLVEPKNTKGLEKAIVKILSNPKLAKKMGEKGKEIINKDFSWDKVAQRFEKIISQII